MNRAASTCVWCVRCREIVPIAAHCSNCGNTFARYFCPSCNLYEGTPFYECFHCDKCLFHFFYFFHSFAQAEFAGADPAKRLLTVIPVVHVLRMDGMIHMPAIRTL